MTATVHSIKPNRAICFDNEVGRVTFFLGLKVANVKIGYLDTATVQLNSYGWVPQVVELFYKYRSSR